MSSTITTSTTSSKETNKESTESDALVLLPCPSPASPFTSTLLQFAAELAPAPASTKRTPLLPATTAGGSSTFLDHPPSPSVLPPPYASNNPFTKASKHGRPTPLGYIPPPTPLASRRKKSIVLSPLLPSNPRRPSGQVRRRSSSHKFHVTRPRQSSYTPTSSGSFSFPPPRTPGSPLAIFPPTPSHLQHIMTRTSSTPTTITIFNEPTTFPSSPTLPFSGPKFKRSESVGSDFALSLGSFESSLPASFLPQPSPPTSPNPSPITHSFPPLSHHPSAPTQTGSRSRPTSVHSLDRPVNSSGSAPHTFGNAPSSPRKSAVVARTVPVSPGSAPRKAKQFLGVASPVPGREDKNWGRGLNSNEMVLQARKEKERRKRAEKARPLPYSKKLEIDAFFGEVAHKPKKHSSSSRSGASSSKWNASAGRNVGGGRGVEHIGEDGTLWMDVEEEQEWAWLLSEIGRGGQPLAHWPIEFSTGISPTTANFPSSSTYHSPSGLATPFEHEEQHLLASADDQSAWTVDASSPPKLVSVLDMPKKSKDVPRLPMDEDSDSGSSSSSSLDVKKKDGSSKEKKRPKPLKLASTLSSSLPKSFTLPTTSTTPTPTALLPTKPTSEEGKTEFLSSTFKPSGGSIPPPSPSYTIDSTTDPAMNGNRPRTSSSASKKSVVGGGGTPKSGKGGLGGATSLVKGFFSRGTKA